MKIVRSSKCSTKFLTRFKKQHLYRIIEEYGNSVNYFIDIFWTNPIQKFELLKSIISIPNSWLTSRIRQLAASEAINMINSVKEAFEWNKQQIQNRIDLLENKISKTKDDTKQNRRRINNWYTELKSKKMKLSMLQSHKPKHQGKSMNVSAMVANLQSTKKANNFDSWLHIASIGNRIVMDIPIKFHRQFNQLNQLGKRLNYYVITKDYVIFFFEIETGPKKEVKHIIGVDTGINALASTSDDKQYGKDIKSCIDRIKRCKQGSEGQQKARRALRQRIDETAKEVVKEADLIVVENLKGINDNTKLKGKLNRSMRSTIGNWNQSYWLGRLKQQTELNRVSFCNVLPFNTSITCPICGCINRMNRVGELFWCQSCNHTGNADIIAAQNIKHRFITGKYGSCYKSLIT